MPLPDRESLMKSIEEKLGAEFENSKKKIKESSQSVMNSLEKRLDDIKRELLSNI